MRCRRRTVFLIVKSHCFDLLFHCQSDDNGVFSGSRSPFQVTKQCINMVTSPTNHTSSAMFGVLEEETPTGSSESMDEQSSIDYSQLMESSTHTSSILGGVSTADANNIPSRRGANASVLESVLEETPTGVEDPSARIHTAESDPIFAELRNQDLPPPFLPTEKLDGYTNTRSSTVGPAFTTMPSNTFHTSNVDPIAYKQMEEETDRFEAWAIHVVLGVFCGLILISVLLTFFVMQSYGLVATIGLLLLLSFTIFLTWFIDRTILSQDAKFKPMRNKIIRVVDVAKKAVVEEFNLFKRDWNEHYLLTNDPSVDEANETPPDGSGNEERETQLKYKRPAKKKRSFVFRMIKPAFRFGRRVFRGKGKSKKSEQTGRASKGYHPPNSGNDVIA